MALVELRDSAKRYGEQTILEGLDLDLDAGEVLSIRGASGTGKSTLLHILGLLDRSDAGTYRFDGVEVAGLPGRQRDALRGRRIGLIFQGCHLLPEFSLLENVLMPARCAGVPLAAATRRARDLLQAVGLPADRRDVRNLSGGEAQRAAICRALVLRPALLLADEPTGALDPATATVVLQLLLGLVADADSALVLVTHDPDLARLARRRCLLREGRLNDCD